MGISVDFTFAIQIVSFFLLWALLKRLLFEPMLDVLEKREERTRGSLEAAAHMHSDVEGMRAEYDERMRTAKHKSLAELEDGRNLTTAEERTILGAARDKAAARLALVRVEVNQQVENAHQSLQRDAGTLSRQLVEKVVGRGIA